jgi:hypothetical protein
MKIKELSFPEVQKSAQECEKKGDRGSEIEDSGSEEPIPPYTPTNDA